LIGTVQVNDDVKLRGAILNQPKSIKINYQFIRGAFVLKNGTVLPIAISAPLSAQQVSIGQKVSGLLLQGVSVGDLNVIPDGTAVDGWICDVQKARRPIQSKLTVKNWGNAHAMINIHFSTLRFPDGRLFQITAGAAPKSKLSGDGESENLTVSKGGSITPQYRGRLYDTVSNAAGIATIPFGGIGFVVDAALSATAGAVDPAYAFDRPVKKPDAIDRTKGFLLGTVKALPCGFLVTDVANHGGDIMIPAGTELDIRLNSDLVIPMSRRELTAAGPGEIAR
jgi:hypothetical protein